jgi:polar amino acid transport system ATP-binding protein
MVEARKVHKSYGRLEVLKGIDLSVGRGEVLCLIGPSGSGKSTFLRCINHLEKIDGGALSVDGDLVGYRQSGDKLYELKDSEVCAKRAEIGMVFQRFNLFPHMSVLDNVISGPVWVKKAASGPSKDRARDLLARVGLADKVDSYPNQLSGGQQQRVAIARSVINRPRLLLADEPTGNVDDSIGMRLLYLFEELNKLGTTVMIATHNEGLISRFPHPRLHLDRGTLTVIPAEASVAAAMTAVASGLPAVLAGSLTGGGWPP